MVCGFNTQEPSGQGEKQNILEESKQAQKQVQQSDISSIAESTTSETKDALSELIEQLQGLKVPGANENTEIPDLRTPEIIAPEVQEGVKQDTTPESSQDGKETTTIARSENKGKTDIKSLVQNSKHIVNPIAAADCLYVHGDYETAGELYQLGLKQFTDTEESFFRPWAMFQAGNCLRRSDPDSAYTLYEQLISEYPESYWTPAARSEQKIIEWFKTNQASITQEANVSDPNSL